MPRKMAFAAEYRGNHVMLLAAPNWRPTAGGGVTRRLIIQRYRNID